MINYRTPIAYIASCHRFREQFTSILFSQIGTPKNSACHNNNPNSHQQKHRSFSSSTRGSRSLGKGHRGQFYSNPISRVSVRTLDTTCSKATNMDGSNSRMVGNSISGSANNASSALTKSRSLGGSIRSKSSLKRSTSSRKKCSRGLLGADLIIVDCDSIAILPEQDSSNSSNPKGTRSPSPATTENGGTSYVTPQKSIYYSTFQTAVRTVDSNSSSKLNTVLQNYGYEFTDLGQLV